MAAALLPALAAASAYPAADAALPPAPLLVLLSTVPPWILLMRLLELLPQFPCFYIRCIILVDR